MEGVSVHSRPWLRILQSLPTPLRWTGMEFTHLIHWLDRLAAQAVVGMRKSPAWFFVSTIGTLGVGLTLTLFISMIEQSSHAKSEAVHSGRVTILSRAHLEKNYEWSTQDHWRVAHFFVPHRPPRKPQDIQLDSRLLSARDNQVRVHSGEIHTSPAAKYPSQQELDVRLELSRPKRAEQDRRFVAGSVLEAGESRPGSRIRQRDSRAMVQAAWDFGPECGRSDYVSVPIRRSIPVPQPEPELEPFPVNRSRPDLGFAMELLRHIAGVSYFPPDSRLVSQSKRTAFPIDNETLLSQIGAQDDQFWRRYQVREEVEAENHFAIDDRNSRNLMHHYSPLSEEIEEIDESLPSATQINLRVEWSTTADEFERNQKQTRLMVENEGREPLQKLEVLDLIPDTDAVVEANPHGTVEELFDPETATQAKLLRRERRILRPGDLDEFSLKWIPESGRPTFRRSRVIAQAAVFAATEVTRPEEPLVEQPIIEEPEPIVERRPGLTCDVAYLDRAYVGDQVELEIKVRNTGETPLHRVLVRIEIPDQLSHPDGKTVIFEAGDLDLRGHNQTILKMSATQVGDAINSVKVAAAEDVEVRGNTRMLIVEREKQHEPAPKFPEVIPSRSKSTPLPTTQKPSGKCCCQRLPSTSNALIAPQP